VQPLAEHLVEDAAVAVIVDFHGIIEAQQDFCGLSAAVGPVDAQRQCVAPAMSWPLIPVRLMVSLPSSPSLGIRALGELERQHPMPTRLERWMRSKETAITALTPRSMVPLAAQSRDEPVP
jgi:hypothetical protein